jgi:hypothetical protein
MLQIVGLQLDNNANPGTTIFDGFTAVSNGAGCVVDVSCCNFPFEDYTAAPMFKMAHNQRLNLRNCSQVQTGIFATKSTMATAYGETNYHFRPSILAADNYISNQRATGGTMSLSTLRNAAASVGTRYSFKTRGNTDVLSRWFSDENLGVEV